MPGEAIWFHFDKFASSHVYCLYKKNIKLNKILNKEYIKIGAKYVREYSKNNDKVIYVKRNKLKRLGPGILEPLEDPKYA